MTTRKKVAKKATKKKATKKTSQTKQERLSKGLMVQHTMDVTVKKALAVFSIRMKADCGDLIRLDVARKDKKTIMLGLGQRFENSKPFEGRTLNLTIDQARTYAQGIIDRCNEEVTP